MILMDQLISAIRETKPDIQVQILYEDQPNADFKSLFFFMQGINKAVDSCNKDIVPYLSKHSNVFISTCGTSFHQQCFPNCAVNLGFCFTAMHWLSRVPCNISNGIHHVQAEPEEAALYAAQAAEDWSNILVARGKELAAGGRMVIVNFCLDENGYHLGTTPNIKRSMYDTFQQLWRGMVTEARITEEEFLATNLCMYYRNQDEVKAPFLDPESTVSKTGLKLVSVETKLVPCPYHENWVTNRQEMDLAAHAHDQVTTMRTWSNSTFLTALDEARPMEERVALVEDMFNRFKALVIENPEEYAMEYVHHYIVMEKEW
eukprot:TRINITY_DN25783_c0_g1_i5.p1 TRINITY_DN25783_c0_g1~~TRINITY_DN25783_c0_g1_i5.p1  ORF type:complete len:317 (+),score=98.80 TRINITY_DN25783_c0_g1_i5:261-1211(+)